MSKNINNIKIPNDLDKIESLNAAVTEKTHMINKIVLEIVEKDCKSLDEIVFCIRDDLSRSNVLSTEILEDYALKISTELYYIGQSQEYLGLRFDAAKAVYKDNYTSWFDKASGTIKDKESYAEGRTLYEMLEVSISERAYKRIKLKVENATELLQSIKKIISRRIAEYELTKVQPADMKLHNSRNKEPNTLGGNFNGRAYRDRGR